MLPNRRLSGFLKEKKTALLGRTACFIQLSNTVLSKCSVGVKYAKNASAAGAPPRTSLGELATLPQTL